MTRHAPQLKWCIAKLGQDMNWWVSDISDKERWDLDELSIVDPRQIHHILDLLEPLREYGLQPDVVEDAFFVFRIAKEEGKAAVRLERISDSIFDTEEKLFCLPDVIDEEKGAYADFLDHVTKLRVQMLNDLIDFEENLTIEELEEDIREQLNEDYMEGRNTPFFQEITSILEYIPEGYESELGEEEVIRTPKEEEDFKYKGTQVWRPPYNWTATTDDSFFGEFIRSAYYIKGGDGSRAVKWKIPVTEPGRYDVYEKANHGA